MRPAKTPGRSESRQFCNRNLHKGICNCRTCYRPTRRLYASPRPMHPVSGTAGRSRRLRRVRSSPPSLARKPLTEQRRSLDLCIRVPAGGERSATSAKKTWCRAFAVSFVRGTRTILLTRGTCTILETEADVARNHYAPPADLVLAGRIDGREDRTGATGIAHSFFMNSTGRWLGYSEYLVRPRGTTLHINGGCKWN